MPTTASSTDLARDVLSDALANASFDPGRSLTRNGKECAASARMIVGALLAATQGVRPGVPATLAVTRAADTPLMGSRLDYLRWSDDAVAVVLRLDPRLVRSHPTFSPRGALPLEAVAFGYDPQGSRGRLVLLLHHKVVFSEMTHPLVIAIEPDREVDVIYLLPRTDPQLTLDAVCGDPSVRLEFQGWHLSAVEFLEETFAPKVRTALPMLEQLLLNLARSR